MGVSFSGSGSHDPDGSVAAYAWNFGDGSSASGASASHTYSSVGNYIATLTVTDNAGANASTSVTITTASSTPPPPPTGFSVGDRIRIATGPLNIRDTANGSTIGTQPTGATGTIVAGPVSAGGNTWVQIDYDNGTDGWNTTAWIVRITSGGGTPPPVDPSTGSSSGGGGSGGGSCGAMGMEVVLGMGWILLRRRRFN